MEVPEVVVPIDQVEEQKSSVGPMRDVIGMDFINKMKADRRVLELIAIERHGLLGGLAVGGILRGH